MSISRKEKRKARITALQTQYACEMSGNEPGFILDYLGDDVEEKLDTEVIEYAGKLVRSVIKNLVFTDGMITERSKNWELNRITLMDRLILRQAIVEMLFIDDVPPKVSIAEAVEIAKVFSTDDSSSFVNGILDSIYNDFMAGKIKLD